MKRIISHKHKNYQWVLTIIFWTMAWRPLLINTRNPRDMRKYFIGGFRGETEGSAVPLFSCNFKIFLKRLRYWGGGGGSRPPLSEFSESAPLFDRKCSLTKTSEL